MKQFFAVLTLIVFISSCGSKTNTAPASDLAAQLKANSWMVHYFVDNGSDLTRQFTSVKLTFNSDGTLSVTSGTDSYNGGWVVSKATDGTQQVLINILALTNIQLLNSTWKVMGNSGTIIEMKDAAASSSKELHIMKN